MNASTSASAAGNSLCDGFLFHVVEESLKCGKSFRVDCREASFIVNVRQTSLDFHHQLVASVVFVIVPRCAALIGVGVSSWTFANAGRRIVLGEPISAGNYSYKQLLSNLFIIN
jgi:hypothetical protein